MTSTFGGVQTDSFGQAIGDTGAPVAGLFGWGGPRRVQRVGLRGRPVPGPDLRSTGRRPSAGDHLRHTAERSTHAPPGRETETLLRREEPSWHILVWFASTSRQLRRPTGCKRQRLFTPDGVIDDYRGGHRVGREVIRAYLDERPYRTVDFLTDVISEGRRLTAYVSMNYADGRGRKLVRFIFTIDDSGVIEHLGNSSVEFVPDDLLLETPIPL